MEGAPKDPGRREFLRRLGGAAAMAAVGAGLGSDEANAGMGGYRNVDAEKRQLERENASKEVETYETYVEFTKQFLAENPLGFPEELLREIKPAGLYVGNTIIFQLHVPAEIDSTELIPVLMFENYTSRLYDEGEVFTIDYQFFRTQVLNELSVKLATLGE